MNGKLDKMRKKKRQTRTKRYTELIRKFFTNDENSNLCPGKRDAVSEKKGQKKAVKVQKRFMTDNLKSLHNKFKKEYNARISFNTFVKVKPFWVVRKKFSQRDTCLCAKHENFRLKIAKLHQLKVLNTLSTKELLQKVACDTKNYDCMYNKCDACKVKIIRKECLTPSNDKFYFYEWVTENVKRKNKKGEEKESRITYKRKVYTDTESLIKLINDELPSFAKHVYNVGHQHEFFSKVKQNLKINEAAIIMDHSENYQSNYAREVQGAHFAGSKNQVSLHTGVIYLGKEWDPKKNKIPFCTASGNLSHKAEAVWAHMIPIIKHAKSLNEKLTVFHSFSDSPTSQYRNKSNIYLLSKFCKELNIEKATRNWSEHGHGKNSADGIGGLVKRTADAKICQEKDIVDAETFLDNVKQLKVHFSLITAEEIDRIRSAIPVEDLVPIKGTLQLHQVTWRNDASTDVGIRTLSCFPCISTCKCGHYPLKPGVVPVRKVDVKSVDKNSTEAEPASSTQKTGSTSDDQVSPETTDADIQMLQVDDFVAALFKDDWFPGKVISVDNNDELVISFMTRSKEYFIWGKPDVVKLAKAGVKTSKGRSFVQIK